MAGLELVSHLERPVARSVVHDENLAVVLVEDDPWDALEDGGERRLGVVGDDEDEEAWSRLRRAGGCHSRVSLTHEAAIPPPSPLKRRLRGADGDTLTRAPSPASLSP